MTQKNEGNVSFLRGTNRPDRLSVDTTHLPDTPLLTEIPFPPTWLPNPEAIKEWMRLAPILIDMKLLTEASLSPLGQLCALHGNIVKLYQAGLAPGASVLGALRNMQNDFGLSPVAQGKMKTEAPKEEKKPNSFSSRGRKNQ